MREHPYVRYAEALIRVNNELKVEDEITTTQIAGELENGLKSFKLFSPSFNGREKTFYQYTTGIEGKPENGYFLAPNITASEKRAHEPWKTGSEVLKTVSEIPLNTAVELKMAIAPIAGEYLRFSESNAGRGKAKLELREIALCAITTTTKYKPCFQYTTVTKQTPERENTCIIPDLPLEQLMNFIIIYKKMMTSKLTDDLFTGRVYKKVEGKKGNEVITFQPKRPLIFYGNFPNPPRSSALASVALLGAIGELAKEADVSTLASKVLESLKEATMYMISYGTATSFTYNHHVIDLAKEGKLRQLVDGIYYSLLYNEGRRSLKNTSEYQKLDLFSSRFLQLFNKPAFKDFISIRAEYPDILESLFKIYFNKTEMIDPRIVSSARKLGRWLNQVAYFAAKSEIKQGNPNYFDDLRKAKSKLLVSLESSAFSAKTGDALIFQVITQAGRISGMDAPEGAALFMEKASSGELALDNAKHLLIAFSRLKNKAEQKDVPEDESPENDDSINEYEDLSNE